MYDNIVNNKPQTVKLNKKQIKNNAGGYGFKISKWNQFNRFLIIGSASGTYYVNKYELTDDNIDVINKCLDEDYKKAVDMIVNVSVNALASKQEPTMYALALAISHKNVDCRRYAGSVIDKVCRIPTHLFMLVKYIRSMRSLGRAVLKPLRDWYNSKDVDKLAFQMLKYRNREGYTHADILRLIKVNPIDKKHDDLYGYIAKGREVDIKVVNDFEKLQNYSGNMSVKEISNLIVENNIPREFLPTELLNEKSIWEALLANMPYMAMVRNLGKMSSIGILGDMSKGASIVISRLKEGNKYIHPIQVLSAHKIYSSGHGLKGALTWSVNHKITEALEKAFYKSFENVVPTGKNIMMSNDISGSMTWTANPNNGLTPMEISIAMASLTTKVEDNAYSYVFSHVLEKFDTSGSIKSIMKNLHNHRFGRTDCSLPMEYAIANKLYVDAFVIYTDNETYAGRCHPKTTLDDYRKKFNPDAKLIVCATESVNHSIADPSDEGMLDISGFSADTPAVITKFINGDF